MNLVIMTRKMKLPSEGPRRRRSKRAQRAGSWVLHDAKARFSELVRRAKSEGPQLVTVHGREEVVVLAAAEFHRLKGGLTGQALVDVLRNSPLGDVDIEPPRVRLPVRDVSL
jgi:prevent-host-death family protein